jgi:hypothetical protein
MSRARVLECCKRFSDRGEEAEFRIRPEHPTILKSDVNVGKVGTLVRSDQHLSIGVIAEELNISRYTVRLIFTEILAT